MLFLAMCLRTLFELVNVDSIVNILLLLLLEEKVLLVSNRVTLLPVGLVMVCRVIDVSIVQFVFISLITLIILILLTTLTTLITLITVPSQSSL